jgi:hypothetical protein
MRLFGNTRALVVFCPGSGDSMKQWVMGAVLALAAETAWGAGGTAPAASETPPAAPPAERLRLVCDGVASQVVLQSRNVTERDAQGRERTRVVQDRRVDRHDDEVRVEIDGATGRIRPPQSILPLFRSGGREGWWDLYDLDVGEYRITARYRFNPLEKPRIAINRRTGRIEIEDDGGNGFRGRCDPEGDLAQRRF